MSAYTYDSREGGERHFNLIVEPERGGALAITAASAQATRRSVQLNYTLSREATVTIHIRNLAGREIATIGRGEQAAAGANTAVWNLQTAQGVAAPSGTYLVVFEAVDADGQQVRAMKSVSVQR
jgi:flagellar hook assembly protein FlgD